MVTLTAQIGGRSIQNRKSKIRSLLPGGEYLACQMNLFLSLVAHAARKLGQGLILFLGRELYDHREVNAGNDFNRRAAQKAGRDVGRRAAKHISENEHAAADVHSLDSAFDLFARHVDVIVPSDCHSSELVDLSD